MRAVLVALALLLSAAPDALACYRCRPTTWAPSLSECPDMCLPALKGAGECSTIGVEDSQNGVWCQCWLQEWGCGAAALDPEQPQPQCAEASQEDDR